MSSIAAQSIRSAPRRIARAQRALVCLSAAVIVATITGTLGYCYPVTLGALRDDVLWLHEFSGDAALLLSIAYLWLHLPRVWSMKGQRLSRTTGFIVLGVWIAAVGTGVWGQFMPLRSGSATWLVHVLASVASIALAGFHGAWGYRARRSGERDGAVRRMTEPAVPRRRGDAARPADRSAFPAPTQE